MRIMKAASFVGIMTVLVVPCLTARAQTTRLIIAEFVNSSTDKHTIYGPSAGDAVAVEFARRKNYEVATKTEVDRAAKEQGLRAPYRDTDLIKVARQTGAAWIVSGEVKFIEARSRDGQRGIEAGVIVRVKDAETGELINGAAERGFGGEPTGGGKTDGELAISAIESAAMRAVQQISAFQPLTGLILNSAGNGSLVLNRGAGHGVRKNQEFTIILAGQTVGHAKAGRVSSAYSELSLTDSALGIQAQDRAVAVFAEPRFKP